MAGSLGVQTQQQRVDGDVVAAGPRDQVDLPPSGNRCRALWVQCTPPGVGWRGGWVGHVVPSMVDSVKHSARPRRQRWGFVGM